ncbi:MAG: type II toxin-antitoxin system PemK/MazF family toxin [Deltaproteobacteria bacterium]|nr:type II toxin-antitoxin system PemK/MazF family toxin [Deltaproteobacteria bacterium]MBW2341277.1 type II toxin-antitoxin system PemK/MazF family toxin [Deltaproteobacteria bacterium]
MYQKNEAWPLDVVIKNKLSSGLAAPSVVRMKLFTLDNRFILRKIGHLSKADQTQVKQSLLKIFDYLNK